jgi:hypothetical protein
MKMVGIKRRSAVLSLIAAGALAFGVIGCGGGSSTAALQIPGMVSAPSRATVEAWPAKFCELSYGESRTVVQAIMGPPTYTFPASTGGDQDQWIGYQYNITVFYTSDAQKSEADQTATQLNINSYGMDAATRATIPCTLVRGAPSQTFPGA